MRFLLTKNKNYGKICVKNIVKLMLEILNINYALNERQKVTNKKINNIYSVVVSYVNSIKFHNNIEKINCNKSVKESIYNEALKILEERDGTFYESIAVIDAITGKEIIYNNKINNKFETGLFDYQRKIIEKCRHKVITIHNHPTSSPLSYVDVKTLMVNKKCSMSIAIGHSGIVYVMKKLKQVDIERVYEATYDVMKTRGENMDGNVIEEYVIKVLADKKIIEGGIYYEK